MPLLPSKFTTNDFTFTTLGSAKRTPPSKQEDPITKFNTGEHAPTAEHLVREDWPFKSGDHIKLRLPTSWKSHYPQRRIVSHCELHTNQWIVFYTLSHFKDGKWEPQSYFDSNRCATFELDTPTCVEVQRDRTPELGAVIGKLINKCATEIDVSADQSKWPFKAGDRVCYQSGGSIRSE